MTLQHPWLAVAISLGGGGLVGQVASLVADLGFGPKLLLVAGTALVIFGSIYFLGPQLGA